MALTGVDAQNNVKC